MANTKDIKSSNANILLVGDSGSHKTWLLGSVPGIYIMDFDKGLAVLRSKSVEYDTFKDLGKGIAGGPKLIAEGLYEWGTGWLAFWKKVQDLNALFVAGKGPPAVGLDSLTFMSMLAVNNILKSTGHDSPHQGTWGAHHDFFKAVFSTMTAWPTRLIATAHIERTNNDLTGVSEKLPLLAGKLAGLVSAFFDECYFCEVAPDTTVKEGNKLKYILKTEMTPTMRQAKTRFGVPNDTPTTWEALAKYMPELPAADRISVKPNVPGLPAKLTSNPTPPVPSKEK